MNSEKDNPAEDPEPKRKGKKRGPKEKPKEEILSHSLRVRINQTEYDELVEELSHLQNIHNLKIVDLVRLKLFPKNRRGIKRLAKAVSREATISNKEIIEITSILMVLIKELSSIGVNINQVVKKINGMEFPGKLSSEVGHLKEFITEVEKLIEKCEKNNSEISKWYQS